MKQKILMTYVESGFGHISSMDSIYSTLLDNYSDRYDIIKSFIMRDEDSPHLNKMEKFIIKQVENTNKIAGFGKLVFKIVDILGGDHLMRFYHRQMAHKSWREGLDVLSRQKPDVIVTNHYFTNMLAVEYKLKRDPTVRVINYDPDCTLHTFWDHRDGIFIVNNQQAFDKALRYKFKKERLRLITPCVRKCVEDDRLGRTALRDRFGLPPDKFTVTVADGGYMLGRGPRFARKLIKSGLPITLCIIAGKNKKRYEEFCNIANGKGKLKVADGMTLKVYEFLPNAYELYGASDVFLTKGGPNAVLDSVYMRTPVMVDYCPHVIEEWTVNIYIKDRGLGETAFTAKKAVRRIKEMMADRTDLDRYCENIERFIALGNGADKAAAIIDTEAEKQREERRALGIIYDRDDLSVRHSDAIGVYDIVTDDDIVLSGADAPRPTVTE